MARLGLERNVVDTQVLDRTIARLGQEGVLLPTLGQLANPAAIPDGITRLAGVDPDVADPPASSVSTGSTTRPATG